MLNLLHTKFPKETLNPKENTTRGLFWKLGRDVHKSVRLLLLCRYVQTYSPIVYRLAASVEVEHMTIDKQTRALSGCV